MRNRWHRGFGSGWLSLLSATVTVCPLVSCGEVTDDGASESGAPNLILTRTHTIHVPADFIVAGLAGASGTSAIVWSEGHVALAETSEDSIQVLASEADGRILAAAAASSGGANGAEYVWIPEPNAGEDHGVHVKTVDANGSIEIINEFKTPDPVRQAAHAEGGWWFMTGDDDDLDDLWHIDADGNVRRVLSDRAGTFALWRTQLSAVADKAVITETDPPYRSAVVDGSGQIVSLFHPSRSTLAALEPDADDRARYVVAGSILLLDTYYLQVLHDLAGDMRVFIVFSDSGRELRSSQVTLPLGLEDANGNVIYGVMSLNGTSIVAYQYSWESGGTS